MFRALISIISLYFLVSLPVFPADRNPVRHPSWKAEAGPLEQLNKMARDLYGRLRQYQQEQGPPEIYVSGPVMILRLNGQQYVEKIVPEDYTRLKSMSHSVLLVYALAGLREAGKDISEELKALKGVLKRTEEKLTDLFHPDQVGRQKKITGAARRFAELLGKSTSPDHKARDQFFREAGPLIKENIFEAAQAQINLIAHVMKKWHKMMSGAQWKQFRVVVGSPKMPRQDNLAVQFFSGLLKAGPEHPRLIVAEGVSRLQDLVRVSSVWHTDSGLGSAYFQEAARLRRDILGDAAREILAGFDWSAL